MTKLNQLIAVNKTVKNDTNAAFTKAYHEIQRTPQLAGISRTYQPRADDGETLPGESTRVQVKVPAVIKTVTDSLERLFDLTAAIDTTNQVAVADIVISLPGADEVLARNVSVSTLLFLEKQLTDLATFVKKLPLLDSAERWTPSEVEDDVWTSEPVKTTRSKKVPRNHVKAKATDKHPEQVEVFFEDQVVGDWTTVKFSGAIPHREATLLLARIGQVQLAVKQAREAANMTEVVDNKIGNPILSYIFG